MPTEQIACSQDEIRMWLRQCAVDVAGVNARGYANLCCSLADSGARLALIKGNRPGNPDAWRDDPNPSSKRVIDWLSAGEPRHAVGIVPESLGVEVVNVTGIQDAITHQARRGAPISAYASQVFEGHACWHFLHQGASDGLIQIPKCAGAMRGWTAALERQRPQGMAAG